MMTDGCAPTLLDWAGYCLPCEAMTKEPHCFLCGAPVAESRPTGWPDLVTRYERPPEHVHVPGGIDPG